MKTCGLFWALCLATSLLAGCSARETSAGAGTTSTTTRTTGASNTTITTTTTTKTVTDTGGYYKLPIGHPHPKLFPAHVPIINSEVGAFARNHPEPQDYGRYTYVLVTKAHVERAKHFLDDLFASTVSQGQTRTSPARLNLFEVPIHQWAIASSSRQIIGAYDYGRAQGILDLVCITASPVYAEICKTARTVGPYLITYAHPIGSQNAITMPYLVVNLSNVQPSAFPYFIEEMKDQVQADDITDSRRIYAFKGFLLNWLLGFKDIEPKIKSGILELIPSKKQRP